MEGLHPGTRRMTIWTLIHVYRTYIDDGQPNANVHDGYLLYGGSGHVRTHVLSLLIHVYVRTHVELATYEYIFYG